MILLWDILNYTSIHYCILKVIISLLKDKNLTDTGYKVDNVLTAAKGSI